VKPEHATETAYEATLIEALAALLVAEHRRREAVQPTTPPPDKDNPEKTEVRKTAA